MSQPAASSHAVVGSAPEPSLTGPSPEQPIAGRGFRHAFRALRHRDFALFWSAALISNVGVWMQSFTVPFVLYKLTHSAAWVGLAAFAQFLPMMVMGSVGGVLADRVSRKGILLANQAGQMVLAFGLWGLWEAGHATPTVIVVLGALSGMTAGLGLPAYQSFVPQLVPRQALLNAVALNSAQFNGARAIGPALTGLVLAASGPGAAFLVNAVTYLAVIGALLAIRASGRTPPTRGRMAHQFRDAITYTRAHPGLRRAVFVVFCASFLGAPVIQLTPVFAREEFHVGGGLYGLLGAAFGTGAVVGAVVIGAYGDGVRRSTLATGGLALFGAALLGLAAAPVYAVGFVALLAMGAGYLVISSTANTAIQLLVSEDMRGRVLALYVMAFSGGFPIGALVEGRLADAVGVRLTVAVAGLGLAVVALSLVARGSAAALDDEPSAPLPVPATVVPAADAPA